MKLTHVFGLVAAIHVAAFTVIFATPGCRSSGKAKPRPEQTDPAASGGASAVAPVDSIESYPVASMSDADINAGYPSSAPTSYTPVSPMTQSVATDGSVRFAPTRPGSSTQTFAPVVTQAPAPSATHTVAKGDSLWSISRKYGVTVAELAAANKLSPSATLRLDQQLTVPAKASAPSAAVSAASDAANTYEVKAGDTLGAIARKQGTTVAALRTANNLSGDMLRVGQKLVIPGNAAPLSSSSSSASSSAAGAPTSSAPRAGTATHSVVSGDTLGSIARIYGVRVGEIATLNNITDPAKLRVGQVLKLPSGARASAPSATPAATPARTFTPAPATTPEPLTPRFDEPTPITPITPVESVEPVEPVEPVTPVEPAAVPVIRIE
jgi:LysM repeat protein